MQQHLAILTYLIALLAATCQTPAQTSPLSHDWPQWRGPNVDGISYEVGWDAANPRELWRAQVGPGHPAVSVVGDRAYTLGYRDSRDYVVCLNVASGETVWETSYPSEFGNADYGGPAATPAVSNGKVYTISRHGLLHCWNARNGKSLWQRDLCKTLGATPGSFGFTGSPVVHGNVVFIDVGVVAAINRTTGALIWKTANHGAGYSTPVPFKFRNRLLLATFPAKGLIIINVANRKLVAQYPWTTYYDINVATPIVSGTKIFISSGYNTGAALVELTPSGAKRVWQNKAMRNHMATCILRDGKLYGFDEGQLKCMDLATGEPLWTQRGMGKGSLMLADEKLIIMTTKGELVIAQASSEQYTELSRTNAVDSQNTWTMPVLSNGRIFCRSDKGDVACFDVSGK